MMNIHKELPLSFPGLSTLPGPLTPFYTNIATLPPEAQGGRRGPEAGRGEGGLQVRTLRVPDGDGDAEDREVAAAIRTARASTVPLAVRLAFEFLVLTAARWGEVRWAEWIEIDRDEGVWTVPARRTKANRAHRVPLCGRALEILDEARTLVEGTSPFVFPNRVGKQLEEKQLRRMFQKHGIAAVPHGFRSSFRDWAAEDTDHPREVIEAVLAHVVQNRVEAAYRRTDLFERRRKLMDDWAAYLAGERREPEAVPIC